MSQTEMQGRVYERCQKHDLALGPDGLCVICRREATQANQPRFGVAPSEPEPWTGRLLTALLGLGLLIHVVAVAWMLLYPETFPLDLSRVWPRSERSGRPEPRFATADAPVGPRGGVGAGSPVGGDGIEEIEPGPRQEGAPDPYANDRQVEAFRVRDRPDDPPAGRVGPPGPCNDEECRRERQSARETAERDRRRREMIEKETRERDMRAALRNVRITMYAASWCPHCTRARRYLVEKGIPFTERDVEKDPAAEKRLKFLNPRGSLPTFEIDSMVRVGFSPSGLQSAIDRAVRLRAKRF